MNMPQAFMASFLVGCLIAWLADRAVKRNG